MRMPKSNMRSTAIAALLSLPVATVAAVAQEATGQTEQSTGQSQDTAQQPSQSSDGSGQAAEDQQADTVVATVGEVEILGSDVLTFIGTLPPRLQAQQPQMLVPMALEQLILRELIIEEARGQNLAEDPEVVALVEGSTQTAEEDALVQVWLTRETTDVVTDEAVQQAYEEAQTQGGQDLPPVEEVRPQIEQYLMQQAMQDIQMRLRDGAAIVLYDPTGRPMEQQDGGGDSSGQSGASGDGSGGQSSEGGSGSSDGSGEQSQGN